MVQHQLGKFILIVLLVATIASCKQDYTTSAKLNQRPNILFAISDDQSFPYASAYGDYGVSTPAFDWIADNGLLFYNAFVAAPQCSPSRAAILTGMNIWQLEEAGTHSSYFPNKFRVFTDALEENGYTIGTTGKSWGPGNWKESGWKRNPAGPGYDNIKYDSFPDPGINKINYQANFEEFLHERDTSTPFFFWYGGYEPHRVYDPGIGQRNGKRLSDAFVPEFLPDDSIIRSDILDYTFEIEWFDQHLGKMIDMLREQGELENTIIVVTADNGMPFPYAKANVNEYGTHVPLAIYDPAIEHKGRRIDDMVSLIDLAPTFLDLAGIPKWEQITGHSLMNIFASDQSGVVDTSRKYIVTGRERHTHARPDNLSYPVRAIRTQDHWFVQNLKPDRWPAGDPEANVDGDGTDGGTYSAMTDGFHDIDASPSKSLILDQSSEHSYYLQMAVGKRPVIQIFDVREDPFCLNNVGRDFNSLRLQEQMSKTLHQVLMSQKDPRILGDDDIFESYPRFARMRKFPGFRESGKYNPQFIRD